MPKSEPLGCREGKLHDVSCVCVLGVRKESGQLIAAVSGGLEDSGEAVTQG